MPDAIRIHDTKNLTSTGQVLVPQMFRKLLGIKPGEAIDFVFDIQTNRVYIESAGRSSNANSHEATAAK